MGFTSVTQLLSNYGWPALVAFLFVGIIAPMALYIKQLHREIREDARESIRVLEGLKHTIDTLLKSKDR